MPVLHVVSAAELNASWLSKFYVVGLTAGTSTLDETIAAVHKVLVDLPTAGTSA